MKKYILYICICIFCAGAAKGTSDTLQFHFSKSIFSQSSYTQEYWNPSISWKNKYKNVDAGDMREKFPGSTTIFVNTTDAWHLLQTLEAFSWSTALFYVYLLLKKTTLFEFLNTYKVGDLMVYSSIWLLAYICYTIGFTLFYNALLVL